MQYIQMEENDYQDLIKNMSKVSHMYSSGNRRSYLSKVMFSYLGNNKELEIMCSDLKYYKKLMAESTVNEITECLKKIIATMEKYIEINKRQ